MKILIISYTFPPNKDGVSEASAAMAKGFVDKGWSVEILTQVTDPSRESEVFHGARVTEFSYSADAATDILIQGYDGNYEGFLTKGEWDAIVFQAYEQPLLLAIPLLKKIPARKILVSHGYAALIWERVPKFPYGLGVLLRRTLASTKMPGWLPYFDSAVYLHELADFRGFYDHLIAKMIGYQGCRVIPNGIDTNERGTDAVGFRRKHGISDASFVFLCIANYSPRKDQGFGARAFRKARIPESVLIFIGSDFNEFSAGYQNEDARNLTADAPGRIVWLEKQSRKSTLDALAACDAFILSAKHEAQPIALLEAMREGKPWIARDAGCIASMEGGICVKSLSAMADAMIRICGDPSLQSRLAKEGTKAIATRYNRKAFVSAYCALMEELVPKSLDAPTSPVQPLSK